VVSPRTVTKPSISADTAKELIDAAERKAREIKVPMVIAIVDESGVLKAFSRMDGAPLLCIDIALNKAYTAAAFGMPTSAWYDMIKDDPPLMQSMLKTPRVVVMGGGIPLNVGGIAGAIGVSGGSYQQDTIVAEAGAAAFQRPDAVAAE
jgi:uncharacterized protein GlcG (DUF336 family)